jgi:hypothetical protein
MILLVPGPREVGPGSSSTRRSRPLPSLLAQVTPSQRCTDPLAAILGSRGVRGNHPQGMNCRVPPSSPGGPSRHAEASADQPRPGLRPDPTAGRRTLTVLTRPAGHRRRVQIPPTPAAGRRPLPTRQASPGRASPCGEPVLHSQAHERRPRRPCHYRAIHSGPDRSPADTHGQCHGCLNLRPSFPPQVTAPAELALQAGGRRFESGGSHHQPWLPS